MNYITLYRSSNVKWRKFRKPFLIDNKEATVNAINNIKNNKNNTWSN